MTYPRHWLLSWGGTVGDGGEIFSNNIRMMNPALAAVDTLGDGDMNGLLDGFVLDLRTLFGSSTSFIPTSVECQWVKFNEIGPDGHYVNQTTTFARYLTAPVSTTGRFKGVAAGTVPTFQSAAITFTTARQRGPASKGRIYVPQCVAGVGSNGRFLSTACVSMASRYAAFLTNLGDEEGIDNTAIAPYVVSNVGEPGPAERITGVKVGDVPDVQRRRKNSMVEVYSAAVVTTD